MSGCYNYFSRPTKVGSNSCSHSLFKQPAFIGFLLAVILMDQYKFISAVALDANQSTAILQLLQLQVGLESAAFNPNPIPEPPTTTNNSSVDTLSTTLQLSVAETTDQMLSSQVAYTLPQQRSADLGRSIDPNPQQPLNLSDIPQQIQDSIANLVAYPKDKTDTSVVAADVVNAVMGLVNGVIQTQNQNLNSNSNLNLNPKYQNGYNGSEVDLLAMMAVGDLQAVLKAVQGWALESQYGKTVGFVQVALEKDLVEELTDVLTYIFQNWSISYESLALQLMAIMQSSEKEQVLEIVVNGMRSAKNIDNIVEVFKYAFLEAQEPIGLAFAELAATSAKGNVCRLGGILDIVTFGLSSTKFQKVIGYLEQVNGDVCIFSFVKTLDVARGISTKTSILESSAGQEGCVEVPPPGGYTCAQQLQFDKCERYWMVQGGYCQVTCGTCGKDACVDVQPTTQFTCSEQKQFGKCQADWMAQGGYCNFTCDRCPASSYVTPPSPIAPVILLSPIPLPTILQPPSPSDAAPMNEQIFQGECSILYNQTVDIIAVMLNEVVGRITQSLQT